MLTYKKKKEEETRLRARFKGRNDQKKKKKRFEHIPPSKKILSLILTVLLSQIFSQSNKDD